MTETISGEITTLVAEIKTHLAALPDRRAPTVRAVRRVFSRRFKSAPPERIIRLARALVEAARLDADSDLRSVAHELVYHHTPALRSLDAVTLTRLGQGIDTWYKVS